VKPELTVLSHIAFEGYSIFDVKIPAVSQIVKFLLLYRSQHTPQQLFYDRLRDIISSNEVQIVLGDFNLNHTLWCNHNGAIMRIIL